MRIAKGSTKLRRFNRSVGVDYIKLEIICSSFIDILPIYLTLLKSIPLTCKNKDIHRHTKNPPPLVLQFHTH